MGPNIGQYPIAEAVVARSASPKETDGGKRIVLLLLHFSVLKGDVISALALSKQFPSRK